MRADRWHVVEFESERELGALPTQLCCNCATTEDVSVKRVTLYGFDDAGAAYGAWVLTLPLPSCRACAPTLRLREPTEWVWSVLGAAIAFTLAILTVVALGLPPWLFGLAGALALAGVPVRRWIRRPPRGARATNFQPVRNLGKSDGLFPTYALAFASRSYGAAVSERVGRIGPGAPPAGELPEARTVSRRSP